MTALDRPYWIEARVERREGWDSRAYPFNLPVVRDLDTLAFHSRVLRNPSLEARKVAPFLVMLSSHHLRHIEEIVVAPLVNDAAETVGVLEFVVKLEGERLTLVISELFSLTPTGLRSAVDNLGYLEGDIRRALDRLFTGF